MSILIVGIEKPINCRLCFASDDESRFCQAAKEYIPMLGKPKFCPLIELPDHGDLIDRDVVVARLADWSKRLIETYGKNDEYVNCLSEVLEGLGCDEVVIPAERSEEGFDGDTWHDLNGATAAPSGMKWQSNGKSRFSGGYMHRLVKKDTGDVVPVVRCKDCKHRPTMPVGGREVYDLEFPDDDCPLQCGDSWYNREPDDDWFCASGERSEG